MKTILLISLASAITSCAYYDTKKDRVDIGPAPGAGIRQASDDTAEKKAAREKAEREKADRENAEREAEIKRIKAQFIENERI